MLKKFIDRSSTNEKQITKELDPQEVFNTIHRAMWKAMENGKSIFYDTSLSLEQRLVIVTHLDARICGMCDVLNALGYEIRDEHGQLLASQISLFSEVERLKVEIARQQKGS